MQSALNVIHMLTIQSNIEDINSLIFREQLNFKRCAYSSKIYKSRINNCAMNRDLFQRRFGLNNFINFKDVSGLMLSIKMLST